MRVPWGFLAVCLALWLGFALLLWVGQESLIFYPRSIDDATRASLAEHALETQAEDGTSLSGWAIATTDPGAGAAIFFGGNSQEISHAVAEIPDKLGLAGAGLNYRGFGDSEGKPSAAALRADALVAFDAASERLGIPPERWVVIGRSLGSHMAAHLAANRPVAGLVLITPFDSVTSVASRRYPIFPVKLMLRHPFDTVAETASITVPTLVIRAEHDSVIPASSTDRLLENWAGKGEVKVVQVPSSRHNDIDGYESYWQSLREFCANVLNDGAPETSGA